VINAMSDGVLVVNREGMLVLYNPAALRLAGFRQFPSVGCAIASCLADDSLLARIREEMDTAAAERAFIAQETQVGELTVLASIAPVRDEQGRLLGAVVLLRDITRAKEMDRLKSEFVSMVSHELKAPISAIEGYLTTILSGYADAEKQRQWLERSRDRAAACLALIQDLLDLSRLEARQVERQVELLAIGSVVDEAAALLKPQADAKGLAMIVSLPERLPRVQGSREELGRLFTNLIGNAIKYNRQGGTITVSGDVEGAYLVVTVSDTGIGIPAEALPRLFTDFFRVKTPETRYITGTGLGLAISKRIADAHQGKVKVASKLGEGSTFAVYLPVTPAA
jgi:two-component system phosphate regulon sensor histidine kinase PhoR